MPTRLARRMCFWTVASMLFASTGSAAEPEAQPPRLVSPEHDGELIPRNSVFVFRLPSGLSVDSGSMFAFINDGMPIEIEPDGERCEFRFACDAVVGPFDLEEGDELMLRVFDVGTNEEQTFVFVASDVVDETAPTIEATAIIEESLGASAGTETVGPVDVLVQCRPEKSIRLEAHVASDAFLAGPTYLVREDGARFRVIDTIFFEEDAFLLEVFGFDDLDQERCYRFVAWDVAGNKGESELACFDLSFGAEEAEEAQVFEEFCADLPKPLVGCSSSRVHSSAAPWSAALLALLGLAVFRRRGSRSRMPA